MSNRRLTCAAISARSTQTQGTTVITRKARPDSRSLRPLIVAEFDKHYHDRGSCRFIAGDRSRFNMDLPESLAPNSGTCFGILRRFVMLLPPKRCARLAVQEDSRT